MLLRSTPAPKKNFMKLSYQTVAERKALFESFDAMLQRSNIIGYLDNIIEKRAWSSLNFI